MRETADPVPSRRARRHEATRRELLDVAWELAAEHGLTGWSLKDLADAVGMRPPSLYVYFASKHDIYDSLFADGYATLRRVVESTERPDDPVSLLKVAAHTFVDFCVSNPPRYQLLFLRTIPGFVPSDESYASAIVVLDATREVLTLGGATHEHDLDLWTALVTGLASQQISNDPGGSRWRGLTDEAVDMFVATRVHRTTVRRRRAT